MSPEVALKELLSKTTTTTTATNNKLGQSVGSLVCRLGLPSPSHPTSIAVLLCVASLVAKLASLAIS